MAWSIVGVGGLTTAASGNLTPSEPAGVQEGDLLVACIAYRDAAAFTEPSGWTMIEQQSSGDIDATNGIASVAMAYIVRGASAPALTFTRTAGDVGMIRIMAYRGNDPSPLGVHSSNTLATASQTNTTASLTTGAAESLIVAVSAGGDNVSHTAFDATDPGTASASTPDTTTAPTAGTWIERADTGTATGADCGLAIADAVRATAGATGTIQTTVSATGRHAMAAAEFLLGAVAINGSVNVTLDAATLAAEADLTINGALNVTLDHATLTSDADLTIQGSVGSTLADCTLAATAQLTIEAALNLTLDPAVLTGESNTQETRVGTLNVTLGEATLAATGTLGIDGEVNVVLGAVTLNAQGWLAVQGSLNVTLDNATLMAVGVMNMDEISVLELGWCGRRWPGDSRIVYGGGVWRVLI